jgi:hypothetical protein
MNVHVHTTANFLLEKNPQHQLDGKLADPQSLSGQDADGQNICPHQESSPGSPVIQPVVYSLY